jgi:hypothetical protein
VIEATGSGVRLRLWVQSRASHTELAGVHGDRLRVRVAAPPVDGAANQALVRFLAERLGVPRGAVRLVGGEAGRTKVVSVDGIGVPEARARLLSS